MMMISHLSRSIPRIYVAFEMQIAFLAMNDAPFCFCDHVASFLEEINILAQFPGLWGVVAGQHVDHRIDLRVDVSPTDDPNVWEYSYAPWFKDHAKTRAKFQMFSHEEVEKFNQRFVRMTLISIGNFTWKHKKDAHEVTADDIVTVMLPHIQRRYIGYLNLTADFKSSHCSVLDDILGALCKGFRHSSIMTKYYGKASEDFVECHLIRGNRGTFGYIEIFRDWPIEFVTHALSQMLTYNFKVFIVKARLDKRVFQEIFEFWRNGHFHGKAVRFIFPESAALSIDDVTEVMGRTSLSDYSPRTQRNLRKTVAFIVSSIKGTRRIRLKLVKLWPLSTVATTMVGSCHAFPSSHSHLMRQ